MNRNQNVSEIIAYIKEKIERCVQKYMSMEQTMKYIQENYQSTHLLTRTIWERLQRDNPDFFKEYYKRCEVARQIATFNELLAQQVDMMHKFIEFELSYVEPATQFQEPNDQIHDQGIASNDFACIEESISSLIDPSLIAAPRGSYLFKSSVNYGIDFQDTSSFEQFLRDLDQQQQILQPNPQQPQHLTDQQVEYCPQQPQHRTLPVQQVPPQSLASNNLYFVGDRFTTEPVKDRKKLTYEEKGKAKSLYEEENPTGIESTTKPNKSPTRFESTAQTVASSSCSQNQMTDESLLSP